MSEQLTLPVPAIPPVSFRGRRVPPARVALALELLEAFNETMGTRLSALRSTGRPSEALSRILGALTEAEPPIELEEGRAMIEATAARPWWEGPPGTGVVFSPQVVERSRELARGRSRPLPWPEAWAQIERGDWQAMHPAVRSFCAAPVGAAMLREQGASPRGRSQLEASWRRR